MPKLRIPLLGVAYTSDSPVTAIFGRSSQEHGEAASAGIADAIKNIAASNVFMVHAFQWEF